MMSIELSGLLLTALVYIGSLFGIAYITEKGWLPSRLLNHPIIYILSLGVCISTWSFYAAVNSASIRGYGYTAYYIGYALSFLLAPVVLQPILNITRTYQLSSMADLFAFRFRSPWAGTLTTIVLLLCIFPLIAIQIYSLASSLQILIPTANVHLLSFIFCLLMILFTILFGSRDIFGNDKHQGLVIAMAFESLIKCIILTSVGLFAVFAIFGGFDSLDEWLKLQSNEITRLDIPLLQSTSTLVVLLFFTASITMPHMFHMAFKENSNSNNLKMARWGFPLYILIVSLPVLPILWAAEYLNSSINIQFSALAIGLLKDSPVLVYAVFIGGMAGCFGISVVIAMAMSSMCVNHILLPIKQPKANQDLYRWLARNRQIFIIAIFTIGYLAYLLTSSTANFTDVSYVSFISCAQFLPGILTLLYWPNGNSKGFLAGLVAGVSTWVLIGLVPLFTEFTFTQLSFSSPNVINWNLVASLSLLTNIVVLISISLYTKTSDEELSSGKMCSMDTLRRPQRMSLRPKNPTDFITQLSEPLGREAARREVLRAINDLGIDKQESRPLIIFQLREKLEANLSGLLGPAISHQIINRSLPYEGSSNNDSIDISELEQRFEAYPGNLSGVARDLDDLRRHHRQVLLDLPMGVCSLDSNLKIALWNSVMEKLTGIKSSAIVGDFPTALDEPWKSLLLNFIEDKKTTHIPKKTILIAGKLHYLSLHKANIEEALTNEPHQDGLVIVIEDLTETQILESGLAHSERLASIGRLAAGVAHEIGNPITGIACLAQNIRDESNDKELSLMAEQIIEQTRRTSTIVQSLVNFSHSGSQHTGISSPEPLEEPKQLISVYDCANEAIHLLSLDRDSDNITILNQCNKDTQILSDKQRLQQVLLNLLSNAIDASPSGTTISVTDSSNNQENSIYVTDQGTGIPAHIQEQIFEPFFTTKDPGKGTGLGLALVYSIVEDLGGNVKIISPADKVSNSGTQAIVTFPCYDTRL